VYGPTDATATIANGGPSITISCTDPKGLPGGTPGGGKRVLVNHKGKELCLPEAALHRHLKHGDKIIDEEEGYSDTGQASHRDSK
jgi:N-methylhydantoinase B/oxoprolinase/acetone carboxylase alpha subunit